MGANIGTTVTAILAALITKSPSALAIAFTHLLFNVYGVILNTLIYRELPVKIAKFFCQNCNKEKSTGPVVYNCSLLFCASPYNLDRR